MSFSNSMWAIILVPKNLSTTGLSTDETEDTQNSHLRPNGTRRRRRIQMASTWYTLTKILCTPTMSALETLLRHERLVARTSVWFFPFQKTGR